MMKIKKEKEIFTENQLVWARMKFCPYWPARIVAAPPSLGKIPANKTCVLFFGTKQFGFIDGDKIEPYVENRSKFVMKGRGTAFNNAIKQMEDYISDPVKNKRNAHVQPSNIVVKTERTVEKCLGIKHEASNLNGSVFNASNSAPAPSTNDWVNEKQELINNIVRLKSENQKCILDLKKSEEKLEILAVANRELEEKCHAITAENDSSQEDLKKTADKLETMAIVNRELEEKCRAIIDENKSNHEETDEGNYHEVECLLRDKIVQKRAYLVRWKGFDSSHDSWILESDLNCPKLLLKYKQSKRK